MIKVLARSSVNYSKPQASRAGMQDKEMSEQSGKDKGGLVGRGTAAGSTRIEGEPMAETEMTELKGVECRSKTAAVRKRGQGGGGGKCGSRRG